MISIKHNNEIYEIYHLCDIDGEETYLGWGDYTSSISTHVQNMINILAAENIVRTVGDVDA